jgi:predicted 3-demethylubiquinone-9 3-methyltransferase (glyoxalase superfamily)
VTHNEMATMLMSAGQAEEAIGLYTSVFPDSGVDFVERYGPENPDVVGQIVHARFTINGQHVLAMDTPGYSTTSLSPPPPRSSSAATASLRSIACSRRSRKAAA